MTRKTRTTALGAGLLILGGAATLLFTSGCSSLSKQDLERELSALGKNTSIRSLERIEFEADLGDGNESFELVYHSATAQSAGEHAPVVLVHGTPSTLFSWGELIHGTNDFAGLLDSRDAYAIEIVGHGIAPTDDTPITFERCARFVSAAVRALGIDRAHLVGSSYGGEFAWRAALNDPELYASLTVIDSSGYRRKDGDWLPEEVEMRENSLAKYGWLINSQDRIETALAPHFDVVPPDRVEEFYLVCANASNWHAMVDLARDENGDREGEIPLIEVPTLVMWGANDIAYSLKEYGERFARDIPDSQLVVLDDTGHYPHEQRPAEVARVLTEFFDMAEEAQ